MEMIQLYIGKEKLYRKEQPQIEAILDKRILRKTKNKILFQYSVKCKNHPTEGAT